MGYQNSLFRMMINSRLVYVDGKTIKDINTLRPEIDFEESSKYDLDENYEIVFYDKESGVMRLEKYDKNKKTLYTLGGLSPEELEELKKTNSKL